MNNIICYRADRRAPAEILRQGGFFPWSDRNLSSDRAALVRQEEAREAEASCWSLCCLSGNSPSATSVNCVNNVDVANIHQELDLSRHIGWSSNYRESSAYVSTTSYLNMAINRFSNDEGWIYMIRATPNFIDVDASLTVRHLIEHEYAALGGIRADQIMGWCFVDNSNREMVRKHYNDKMEINSLYDKSKYDIMQGASILSNPKSDLPEKRTKSKKVVTFERGAEVLTVSLDVDELGFDPREKKYIDIENIEKDFLRDAITSIQGIYDDRESNDICVLTTDIYFKFEWSGNRKSNAYPSKEISPFKNLPKIYKPYKVNAIIRGPSNYSPYLYYFFDDTIIEYNEDDYTFEINKIRDWVALKNIGVKKINTIIPLINRGDGMFVLFDENKIAKINWAGQILTEGITIEAYSPELNTWLNSAGKTIDGGISNKNDSDRYYLFSGSQIIEVDEKLKPILKDDRILSYPIKHWPVFNAIKIKEIKSFFVSKEEKDFNVFRFFCGHTSNIKDFVIEVNEAAGLLINEPKLTTQFDVFKKNETTKDYISPSIDSTLYRNSLDKLYIFIKSVCLLTNESLKRAVEVYRIEDWEGLKNMNFKKDIHFMTIPGADDEGFYVFRDGAFPAAAQFDWDGNLISEGEPKNWNIIKKLGIKYMPRVAASLKSNYYYMFYSQKIIKVSMDGAILKGPTSPYFWRRSRLILDHISESEY